MAEAPSLRDEPLVPAAHDAAVSSNTGRIGGTTRAWSLGWLLYVFALVLIVPLLGFGLYASSRVIAAQRADGEEQLRRTARTVSAAIDRDLKDIIEELQALTASSELREGDLAGFHRYASAALLGTQSECLSHDPRHRTHDRSGSASLIA